MEHIKHLHFIIEDKLAALVPKKRGPHSLLSEAARYSLLCKAKRLRPLLTLSVLFDLNQDIQKALDPACAIEMIHTFSLIHDDLPCMDNAHLRRGKPTLHTVYGSAHAILTGDFLLSHAFSVIAKTSYLNAQVKLELIDLLSDKTGQGGMISGQVVDLLSEGKNSDHKTLTFIFENKTAALISASLKMGAMIAGVNKNVSCQLEKCGLAMGVAFQMLDDILDVTSDEATLGKPTGADKENKKSTFLKLFGYEKALTETLFYFKKAKQLADGFQSIAFLIDQNQSKILSLMS